jgi:predicted cupin superfamily sugar epimerase
MSLESVNPVFKDGAAESERTKATIQLLKLQQHPEGGYFVETDRSSDTMAVGDKTRNQSTTIYYLLTPKSSFGGFHRNKSRTVHTVHSGRGRYVVLHTDELDADGKARVEVFDVGHDLEKGETLQFIVDGNKFKSSYLLPDRDGETSSDGLLISEVR